MHSQGMVRGGVIPAGEPEGRSFPGREAGDLVFGEQLVDGVAEAERGVHSVYPCSMSVVVIQAAIHCERDRGLPP